MPKSPSQHSTSPASRATGERTKKLQKEPRKGQGESKDPPSGGPFGGLTAASGDSRLEDTDSLNNHIPHCPLCSLQSKQQSNSVLLSSGLLKEAELRGKEGAVFQLLSKE